MPQDASVRFEVIEERYFSPHHMLIRMAAASLFQAQRHTPIYLREEHILTSIVMSSLAIEALCNAIGYRVVEGWADYEQISPWAKIRLLCSNLGVAYDRGAQPWQRLQALLTFRNQIAHGKPEYVQNRRVLNTAQLEAVMSSNAMNQPLSSLESKLTLDNARSALAVVRQVEELLTENIPHELKLGIAVEGWTYRSREIEAEEDGPSGR